MDNRPIGLFDSGVGGLSILTEVKKSLPNESFIFLADQANVPYGAKTKKQLEKFTEKIVNFLLKFNIKMLIVACNTASCYTIDYLRSKFEIPIVGVVPAIKPATNLTKNGKIAIMSTPATAKSKYLKDLVAEVANGNDILKLGCEGLEDSVETLNYKKIQKLLNLYTSKIKRHGADTVVLGCTHYPFLRRDIVKRIGKSVNLIDSGEAIAQRVSNLLANMKAQIANGDGDIFYTTGDPQKFSKVASILLQYKIAGQKAYL